jgi:peptidoglycan/LPS O-acetylase OafA/YrhL
MGDGCSQTVLFQGPMSNALGTWRKRLASAPSRSFLTSWDIPNINGTAASSHLDLIRGLAAIAVLISHLRNIFFVDYGDLPSRLKGALLATVYFTTDLGHQAVIVFFVLSGFLIGGSVIKTTVDNRWSWRSYLINRGTRLYVVLIPALLLGLVLDRAGMALSGRGIYGGYLHNHVIEFPVAERTSITILLGNALFLQGILVKPFGSNAALWSLSYEFWYYILFPFLICMVFSAERSVRLSSVGATALILVAVGKDISLYLLVWLCGAILNLFPRQSMHLRRSTILACLGVFVLGLIEGRLAVLASSTFINDLVLGLATATLTYALVSDRRYADKRRFYTSFASGIAGFSYSLYLVHLPFLVLIKSQLDQSDRWQPTATTIFGGLAIGAAVLFYAVGVAHFTERRTDNARRRLGELLESLSHTFSFLQGRTAKEALQ